MILILHWKKKLGLHRGVCECLLSLTLLTLCVHTQDKAHQAKQEGKGLLGTAQDKVSSFLGTSQSKAEDAKDTAQVKV